MNITELAQKLFSPFQDRTAGNAVAVLWNGEVVYQHTAGWAQAEKKIPVVPTTRFCIGSITKTMTAIHVMQLVEAGKIQLDDPVKLHLKSIQIHEPYLNNPIRVRHLLTHTSGLGYFRSWKDLLLPAGALGTLGVTPGLKDYYQKGLTPICAPMTRWAYSNHAFALLGQLVEDVTGKPFEHTFTAQVLRTAGMQTATLQRPQERAMPYLRQRKAFKPAPDLDIIVKPAGSVYASLEDMLAYARSLLTFSPALLGRDSFAEMYRRQYQAHAELTGMGLGFVLENIAGEEVYFHTGGWIGYNSALFVCPGKGAAVIMMSNSEAHDILALPGRFIREALAGTPESESSTPIAVDTLKFAHSYAEPAYGLEKVISLLGQPGGIRLVAREGQLFFRTLTGPWRKGVLLKPRGGQLFEIDDPHQPVLCRLDIAEQKVVAIDMGLSRLVGRF
ncbi:serine hydrolase domain-containing protein [Deinococcus cellulosilyticus]|uniref:Beta-lactamase-related domain-containing protein n=1 Tax=Deinococcus cellulosilyticus (strain DSM 18568 / NBRC 106333 / KACC 11606 / 5516J-15) TaxID=1223518 RepID=A0A511MXQ3_DEIC1|nr:serine hydrolase domain-containing protein [Deinococcus cellulosilyticus]GEM45131.1 hypothetical protein DC3_07660 [Deinococcus cellulosilyticus NBRC 106333 = KACC 11606]